MRDLIRQITQAYTSTRLEGQEGGSVVFSAQEPGTKQPVWIRILPRILGDDPRIATRFRAVAQTVRQLNHPNIASIRVVGEKEGLPYVVTRVVERAQPLAAKLDQPWAVDSAADVIMQVGDALEYAYRKGLVHGSLSPQDVLVQENGRVQVSGFGVGPFLDLLGVQLKQAASPYLAPERAAGNPADARADVYALAAILYGLLARRQPQVLQGQVLPPGRFNPEVPPDMDRVVTRALAQNPADRYPDVKAFLVALGAVTLLPNQGKVQPITETGRCPQCGALNPTGRFCRKCGTALVQLPPAAAPPAQPPGRGEPLVVTPVQMRAAQIVTGSESGEVKLTMPPAAPAPESTALFPEPLPMPQVNLKDLWVELSSQIELAKPELPSMPVIDWAMEAPSMPQVSAGKPDR
jgi:serine/threonine protein kinase